MRGGRGRLLLAAARGDALCLIVDVPGRRRRGPRETRGDHRALDPPREDAWRGQRCYEGIKAGLNATLAELFERPPASSGLSDHTTSAIDVVARL